MIRLFHTQCSEEEIEIASGVLRHGQLVMGEHVHALEHELADYLGVDEDAVVTCASGTDALVLALEELVMPGEEVIVPAMTFSATYEAVLRVGAKPVVADVDPLALCMTASEVARLITKHTAAVILVHLYGWPARDVLKIKAICETNGLAMIEDTAQALGSEIDGCKAGTIGEAAAFSFYPTKPLGGVGDGGAVLFKETEQGLRAKARRNHGREYGAQNSPGYNSRLDEVNAAVLRHRLRGYGATLGRLRSLAGRYRSEFHVERHDNMLPAPYVLPGRHPRRDELIAHLAKNGIESRPHYDPPVSGLPYVNASCPAAAHAAKRIVSLPCHRAMTLEQVDVVCAAVSRFS